MKIWIKIIVGAVLGAVLGLLLPLNPSTTAAADLLAELMVHIGRYVLYPMIFFSAAVAIHNLKEEKRLHKIFGKAGLYILGTTLLLTLIGVLSAVFLPLDRIPIIIEEQPALSMPGIQEIATKLFPRNLFQVFTGEGSFLLPLYLLSFFLGLNLGFDKLSTRPVIQLLDSLSRIFYHINQFVNELLGFALIPITAWLFFQIRSIEELNLYYEIILLLAIDGAVVIFGIYPLALYLLGGRKNPYKWLFGSMSTLITALVSGDSTLALTPMIHNSNENLGLSRKVSAPSLGLFAMFGKAGTSLVTGLSFIMILKSYSSLGVTFTSVLWVLVFSFLISLATGAMPGMGSLITLSLLCGLYGHGLQKGHLLLSPIVPILMSFAAVMDAATALWSTMLIGRSEHMQEEKPINRFS